MSEYDDNFLFSDVKLEQAKLLPKGWIWKKYDDGSGCLKSPDGKDYMSYDLSTNEYQVTRDSSYDFFPLSYYYGDGFDPSEFNPFDYMEQEVKRLFFKETDKEKQERLTKKYKEYQDIRNNISDEFNYDDFGFYLGIHNVKEDLSIEEIDRLMYICYSNSSYYLNSMYLAEQLTESIYVKNYLSLDELEQVPSEDIYDILSNGKTSLLKNYSSQDIELEK